MDDLPTSATLNPIFIASLFFLVSLILIITKLRKSDYDSKSSNFPPSPPRLPVIGNLHQLGTEPHRSLRSLSEKYGPIMLLNLGQSPTIVISSAELVKEMVKNHDVAFSDRPRITALQILMYGCEDIAFGPYGEYWKQARKVCTLEFLSMKKVQDFQPVKNEEVDIMMNRLLEASRRGDAVNLSQMMIETSNNVISRCIFGRRAEENGCRSKFGELGRKLLAQAVSFCVGDYFPWLSWVDVLTGFFWRLKVTAKEFDKFWDKIIEEHEGGAGLDSSSSHAKDFVNVLLELKNKDLLGFDPTPDRLKALLADMFIAASDTTSVALEWLLAELIRNPRVMKNVQEEIRNVLGDKNEKIEMDDINKMSYLKCVIKENLRLHPPAPLLIARKTMASVKLGGYSVPKNTTVLINAWAIHRSSEYWDRAEEFWPERFLNNPVDFKGQDFQFIPFGVGRRRCPGDLFGISSIEYVIANLLYWFDWKMPSDGDMDMTEAFGLTVSKRVPIKLVPISHFTA